MHESGYDGEKQSEASSDVACVCLPVCMREAAASPINAN